MKKITIKENIILKYLMKVYYLGIIPIILTPCLMLYIGDITKNFITNENTRLIINASIYFIGLYLIPTTTFWIFDYKPIIKDGYTKKRKKGDRIKWE